MQVRRGGFCAIVALSDVIEVYAQSLRTQASKWVLGMQLGETSSDLRHRFIFGAGGRVARGKWRAGCHVTSNEFCTLATIP